MPVALVALKPTCQWPKGCCPTYCQHSCSPQPTPSDVSYHSINTATLTSTFTNRAKEALGPIAWALKSVRHCGVVQDGAVRHFTRRACVYKGHYMYHKNTSAFTTLSASYTTFRERVWATTSGQSATTVSQSHRGNGHRKSKGLQNDASPTYRPPSSPVERKKKMKLFRAAFTNKIIDVTHRLESILALKRLSVYTLFLVFHRFGTVYSFETCSHTAFENLGKCKHLQLWGSVFTVTQRNLTV